MKKELPVWLDKFIWSEFKKHRKLLRKPMTSHAEDLILLKCQRTYDEYVQVQKETGYEDKNLHPNFCLNDSIERGWQTIFPKPSRPDIIRSDHAPPMYRGTVLNPDYQEWLANKDFMNINEHGHENTSTDQLTRNKALRSIQRAKFDVKDDSMAREITESEQRRLN